MIAGLLLAVTIVAHEPGYTTTMANHLRTWLGDENVPARVVTASQMSAALQNEKIAFLVGFANPTPSEMRTLREYRAKGGKLVVFYSAAPELAALMGVQVVGYQKQPHPGAWSRMQFAANDVGFPTTVQQHSTVLMRARPIPGKGRVLATWYDRNGRNTGEPAWIATSAGYWMTHVLLSDGDEDQKSQLLGAIVGSVDSKLWNLKSRQLRREALQRQWKAIAMQQVPRKGEIHAVWDHSGAGLYPGDWPRTMRVLANSRVTDLFVNVAGAGFAHYPSMVLPQSQLCKEEGDQLAKCLEAARGTGIRVHAWVLCFSATRGNPDTLKEFSRKGWRLKTNAGVMTEYLNPANAGVRSYMLSAIDELLFKYPQLSGVHLDFVRWGDGTQKPSNAQQYVSQFVASARSHVKRPKWLTAAVYGKYPQCVSTVGQDWGGWLDSNLVDYVVPMDYTESLPVLNELLSQQAEKRSRAQRTIVGVGVTANESRLDPRQVIEQIKLSRKYGFAGNALFDLDATLEKKILPYLRLGIW